MNNLLRTVLAVLVFGVGSDLLAQRDTSMVSDSVETLREQVGESEDVQLAEPEDGRPQSTLVSIRSRFSRKLQLTRGIIDGAYAGSGMSSYQRCILQRGSQLSAGIILEKDAGEARWNDLATAHLLVKDVALVSTLVVGDYYIEAAQGLVLWRGIDFSKGAEVFTPTLRRERGVRPHTSANEHSFLSGVAGELQLGAIHSTLFYSRRQLSASVDSLGSVTSLPSSGLHRTSTEQLHRGNLTENLFGIRLRSGVNRLHFGTTVYTSGLSRTLMIDAGRRFSGDHLSAFSFDFSVGLEDVALFGEWARVNNIVGGISGIILGQNSNAKFIASVRHYPRNFFTMHGLAFGERSSTSNEQGIYLGVSLKPSRRIRVSSYFDQYRFPESPGSYPFSTGGNDFLIQVAVKPSAGFGLTTRYQRKVSDEPIPLLNSNGFETMILFRQQQHRARLSLDYAMSESVTLRSRVERIWFVGAGGKETGMLFFEDIRAAVSERFSWHARVVLFNTDSFNSRIYEYENDLDGVFSLPVLYGRGVRWYFLGSFRVTGSLEVSAKYSELLRDDVKYIGSGDEALPGNRDNKIAVQLDVRF